MEEKKYIKISLSNFFLIIAIIVIIIMAYFLYNSYNEKVEQTKKVTSLSEQLSSVESKYDSLNVETSNSTSQQKESDENKVSTNKNISKDETNPNQVTEDKSNVYSYNDIKGLYKGVEKDTNYELYLYENGTFSYSHYVDTQSGVIGNYIIENNTIVLNHLFNTGSDAGLTATSGSKTLSINSKDLITDSENIQLKRDSSKEDIEYYTQNNVNDLINNYDISNKAN